ncbi:MAG: DUF3365 domain-containing protein [Proteobacteria bacterium]|nr:DUF3365 domain-containing protein [Pseudomonadota bacterium]
MHIPRPSKIQTKFFSALLFAIITLGILFSGGFYLHMRTLLEEEVRDKARLIFMHVDSIQHYVRDVLRPTMYERLPSAFIIQAMSSSYISREIMAPVNNAQDGTIYRRVAIDARNPDYEANEYERELISHFRGNNKDLWQGYKEIDGEKYYLMIRPVRFDESCMYCHGKAEDAPVELNERYGNRGFGKELGAIAGVDFVGISVHSSVGRVKNTILTYFVLFAFLTLLLFFTTNLLFKVLVVNNLKRLNNVFRRNITDAEGSALLQKLEQDDEIEELVDGMEMMSEHLFEARSQLQNYAENLRMMVDERTQDLSREVEARRADVHLFVRLLEDMRKSSSRAELWRAALPQICKRYGAKSITYTCTMGVRNSFVWPETGTLPDFPENFVEMLTGGTCIHSDTQVYVPVESSSGTAEGLLCLYWDNETEAGRHDRNVLQALGRQLGTVAENLTAIDGLLRQMNVLETIVEGITEPLTLMDIRNGSILTVNEAARKLSTALTDGSRADGNVLPILCDLGSVDFQAMLTTVRSGCADQRELNLPNGRSFSVYLYPVSNQAGSTDQVVIYVRETTTEKRMLLQAWHSEKMATVGKLTAGLAHEINNPLGVILCYTGLLGKSITDSQQATDLKIIERHTRRAQRVLQKLLNFARPKTAASGTADACAVVTSVAEVFYVQAAKKRIRLRLDCGQSPLPVKMGIGELEQVISNLMINALDAVADDNGEIHVNIKADDGMVVITIADNGPGVTDEESTLIFDPFYSTKEIGAGTGLGLTIVYGMVTDVGGWIDVKKSAELGGAQFILSLPAAKDALAGVGVIKKKNEEL